MEILISTVAIVCLIGGQCLFNYIRFKRIEYRLKRIEQELGIK